MEVCAQAPSLPGYRDGSVLGFGAVVELNCRYHAEIGTPILPVQVTGVSVSEEATVIHLRGPTSVYWYLSTYTHLNKHCTNELL